VWGGAGGVGFAFSVGYFEFMIELANIRVLLWINLFLNTNLKSSIEMIIEINLFMFIDILK